MKAPNVTPVSEVHQRDDALWQIGVDDAGPGPFETREFAMSVAAGCGARQPRSQSRKSNIGRRGLRDPPETQNSRSGAGHTGAERRNIEDHQNIFDPNGNLRLVKT